MLDVTKIDSELVELREFETELTETVRDFDDVTNDRVNDSDDIVTKLRETVVVGNGVAVTEYVNDSGSELVAVAEAVDDPN
jgi:hypothetical protein